MHWPRCAGCCACSTAGGTGPDAAAPTRRAATPAVPGQGGRTRHDAPRGGQATAASRLRSICARTRAAQERPTNAIKYATRRATPTSASAGARPWWSSRSPTTTRAQPRRPRLERPRTWPACTAHVSLHGGSLRTGPQGSGFTVHAVLPLDSSAVLRPDHARSLRADSWPADAALGGGARRSRWRSSARSARRLPPRSDRTTAVASVLFAAPVAAPLAAARTGTGLQLRRARRAGAAGRQLVAVRCRSAAPVAVPARPRVWRPRLHDRRGPAPSPCALALALVCSTPFLPRAGLRLHRDRRRRSHPSPTRAS